MGRIALMACFGGFLLSIVSCGPRYACLDTMAGVKCETPTEVYRHLMEGDLKDQINAQGPPKRDKEAPDKNLPDKRIHDKNASVKNTEESGIPSQMELREERKPIRIQPRVVRLWLAPWEDSDGDLNMGGFIFTEVAGKRKWVLGEKRLDLDSLMTPRLISPLLQKKEGDVKEKPDGKDKSKGRGDEPDKARNPGNTGRPKGPGPP